LLGRATALRPVALVVAGVRPRGKRGAEARTLVGTTAEQAALGTPEGDRRLLIEWSAWLLR
jgi:hypothetical protein